MPWWGWVLLVVAAGIIAPIKLKILKKMLNRPEKPAEEDY